MDVQQRLDEIVATVDGARSMPMSASCVVNRAELLAMLEDVREALPGSLAQAQELLGGREQMVAEAQQEAQRIIEQARAERGSLVAETGIARQAQQESERILAEARREAEEIRAQADDYVDSKLANFEVVLGKTIGSVERGRDKLLGGPGRHDSEDVAYADDLGEEPPERTSDPEELRHRADEYVDARLGSVAAVLTKTLEAVGRGRQKLLGHRPIDELGAHMAAQDGVEQAPQTGDAEYAEYLAGLADVPAQASADPSTGVPAQVPEQPDVGPYQPAAAEQDPYAQQAAYYGQGQGGAYPQGAYYAAQQPQGYEQHYYQQPAALDEASLFDTGMIDLDQVARYEQQYAQQYAQQHGDGGYGGPDAHGQDPYGQDPYGQDPYSQNAYGQGAYGPDRYAPDPGQGYAQGYGQGYDPRYGPGGDGS